MKRLMFMISTEGKTPAQITKEASLAIKKYKAVEKKVQKKMGIKKTTK